MSRRDPQIYLWPEGGPRMRCRWCGKAIDPNDGTWNEDIHDPAHKLCANSVPTDWVEMMLQYPPPVQFKWQQDMHTHLKEKLKQGDDFTPQQYRRLRKLLYHTALWEDERGVPYPWRRGRYASYAARFLAILDGRLGVVERTSLSRKRAVVQHGYHRKAKGGPGGDPDRVGRKS